jgi:hypothetical protein
MMDASKIRLHCRLAWRALRSLPIRPCAPLLLARRCVSVGLGCIFAGPFSLSPFPSLVAADNPGPSEPTVGPSVHSDNDSLAGNH